MSIFSYYARRNKKALLENKISSLKKVMKQEGDKSAFYLIHKAELEEAEQKLKEYGGNCGE